MNKSIITVSLSALAVLGAQTASAEEIQATVNAGAPVKVDARVPSPTGIKPELRAIKAEIKAHATSARADMKAVKVDAKAQRKEVASTSKAQMEAKREALKVEIEARKAELKEKKAEFKDAGAARIGNVIQNAVERLNHALERLAKIKDMIETRLAKLESAGGNTAHARAELAVATEKIEAANAAIQVVADFHSTSTSASASTTIDIQGFKEVAKNAQSAVIEAHKSLMNVVSEMKGIQGSIKGELKATTTGAQASSSVNVQ